MKTVDAISTIGDPTTTNAASYEPWRWIVTNPPPKFMLYITPQFKIYHNARPTAWVRFWQRVLLGWTWRDLR